MDRRNFLKLVGAIPLVGLAVKERSAPVVEHKTLEDFRDAVRERLSVEHDRPIGIALEDIPKGEYGWVQLGGPIKEGQLVYFKRPKGMGYREFKERMTVRVCDLTQTT